MYLLDTNVISELRKSGTGRANPRVQAWSESVDTTDLYLSAITVLELEHGIVLIERRDSEQGRVLRLWLENQVLPSFEHRILALDLAVARRCAALHIPNLRPERDALIAATAQLHGLGVVTRNVTDFTGIEIPVINPWEH